MTTISQNLEDIKAGLQLMLGGLHDLDSNLDEALARARKITSLTGGDEWPEQVTEETMPITEPAPPTEPAEPAEPSVSLEEVRQALATLATSTPDGKNRLRKILTSLGAEKLSDLTEDQYATALKAARDAA